MDSVIGKGHIIASESSPTYCKNASKFSWQDNKAEDNENTQGLMAVA